MLMFTCTVVGCRTASAASTPNLYSEDGPHFSVPGQLNEDSLTMLESGRYFRRYFGSGMTQRTVVQTGSLTVYL